MTPLLAVAHLSLSAQTRFGRVPLVDDVSFAVTAGGALGIVGESGSGKSLTLRAILGLLPPRVTVDRGTIEFGGDELDERELRRVRGRRIAAVFQEPAAALDPLMRVGEQIGEALFGAFRRNRRAASRRAVELLTLVGMADPEVVARLYPHELSGGMQQRACIAAALCRSPELVLLDEPTTALDVTIQDQVLDLVARLRQELGLAIVLVTHDLGVVAETCDDVTVLYAGRVVEQGSVREVFEKPAHPYTSGLIRASPQVDRPGDALEPIPGAPPEFGQLPSGCRFHPRCPLAITACHAGEFPLLPIPGGRSTACIRHDVLTGPRTSD